MGQVMQRMRLSWTGSRTLGDRALNTFRTVLILVICYLIFDISLASYIQASNYGYYHGYYGVAVNPVVSTVRSFVGFMFTCWSIYALYKTRQNGKFVMIFASVSNVYFCCSLMATTYDCFDIIVRSEFSIPEERCIGCEDVICASFCGCCTGEFY